MKIGFIGGGNMGSALMRAIAKSEGSELYLFDTDRTKAEALCREVGAALAATERIASECDFIFLAVKPNIIPAVAKEISPVIKDREGVTVVSMAAGVDIASILSYLGTDSASVIRIMPNTPVSVGRGMILWCASDAVSKEAQESFLSMMAGAGTLDKIPEKLIDAASAVSGCGPAFVFMFLEAMADGGVSAGLPRDRAQRYAAETLVGAAELLIQSGQHPGELKDAVCSPGGSTIAGVGALEDGAFRATVMSAVLSAYERTLELGKK